MKKYIKIAGVALLTLSLTGCSDSFLSQFEPQGYISQEQLEENAKWNTNIMLGQAAGITATSFAMGTGGTDNHDDFGQKSIDIATDLMSGDMVMKGETYGWFSADARLINNTKDRTRRTYMAWRYYFQVIKAANSIFDTVGGDGKMPDEGSNRVYYGQAKAFRAYAYFNMVNLYARPYDVAKNEKALPIYTSQLTAETSVLSTVDEIYTFIINDLKEAITALDGARRTDKGAPDVDVARGLLAYAYLSKGDYALAAEQALAVIDRGAYPLMTKQELLTTGFASIDIPEFMWCIDLTKDNSPALPTFWGHVDLFTYSYAAAGDLKMIPDNLYKEIPATDIRKGWFFSNSSSGYYLAPIGKFFDKGRAVMGDRLWENDEVYMRTAEMYLIASEASLRAGDLATAKTVIAELLADRDEVAAAAVETMTSEELLELLYFNWRVEMWGEGRGLLTMKRFKKTVVRGANDFAYKGESFSYDDSRFYFEIPEREITNNPNL
ncbi:hypothetical protein M2137_001080 [Parabacteroides sp. PFB2-10]|uniref:RagB/SusD family nutrient uptake outer membrane protein n=1 Tax=Parabacteroides sp. PFB2-10 TaxID=1742405 RepID=UPI002475DE65|nr:RagB/SusD family nutrient uptake outer membrane protein [Parabacteroides sp. PFB2-10]MDH6312310.1 hypothetical protein [Parabacteroides sp. PFB2-10]